MKPLRESSRHDPDHARMPAAVGQYERRIAVGIEPLLRLFRGRKLDAPLLRLPLGVELVHVVGEGFGPGCIRRGEQFDATGGLAESAGRIEAGGEPEGHVFAVELRLLMKLRQFHEPSEAGPAPQPQAFEAVLHEDPVLVEQRHDVGHGPERRQTDRLEQHLAESWRHLFGPTGPRGDRPCEFEGHAGAAQLAEGVTRTGEPRMHEHGRLRKRVCERVVIGDDQFEAEFAGPGGLGHARDPAIDRDDEARALRGERLEGCGVQAVALLQPIGHVPRGLCVERIEASHEDRGGAHAVGVVITVDDDLPAGPGGGEDPIGGVGHARQRLGIAEIGERAREERLHGGCIGDAAGGEQGGHDARHAGRPFERRNGRAVVGADVPAFGHEGGPSVAAEWSRSIEAREPAPKNAILPARLRRFFTMAVADIPLPVLPAKPKREDVPQDQVLCEFCTAKCCRYFALPLETPTTREEFEYIRWFLLHEHATVFTEEGDWYVCVHTVCKHLQDDHRCGIYETRPQICREYTTKECEYEDDWVYDQYFETCEQVEEYMDAVLGPGGEYVGDGRKKKNRGKSIRSPKPPLLQILS